jgi:hypothetical protein
VTHNRQIFLRELQAAQFERSCNAYPVPVTPVTPVLHSEYMNKEKPTVISPRVYKKHRVIIKKAARKLRVSEAEIVRRAIELFAH